MDIRLRKLLIALYRVLAKLGSLWSDRMVPTLFIEMHR